MCVKILKELLNSTFQVWLGMLETNIGSHRQCQYSTCHMFYPCARLTNTGRNRRPILWTEHSNAAPATLSSPEVACEHSRTQAAHPIWTGLPNTVLLLIEVIVDMRYWCKMWRERFAYFVVRRVMRIWDMIFDVDKDVSSLPWRHVMLIYVDWKMWAYDVNKDDSLLCSATFWCGPTVIFHVDKGARLRCGTFDVDMCIMCILCLTSTEMLAYIIDRHFRLTYNLDLSHQGSAVTLFWDMWCW